MLLSTDDKAKAEHEAVRNAAGWYYFTHQLLEVSGEDAGVLLDKMYTNSISKAKVGSAKYTTMLNENGIIIDDVIVFHMEENKYWISTLHISRPMKWLKANKGASNIMQKNITSAWDMYSVQGPKSQNLVNSVLVEKVDDMKFFTIKDNKIGDIPVKVARSGYSGEKFGYEIYVAPESKGLVEAKLSENEKKFGAVHVTEIDVMAYTLATEKGFVLVTDICDANPFEVGMDKFIDWSKDFIGKAALEKIKAEGVKRQLVGFIVDDKNAKIYGGPKGAPIVKDGEVVGKATKFTHGFTVGKNIGYALIETAKAKIGDHVTLNYVEAVLTDRPILK
jgi:aminomethyltransferase